MGRITLEKLKELSGVDVGGGAGLVYRLVYGARRGSMFGLRLLSTLFHRRVIGRCGQNVWFGTGVYLAYPSRISIEDGCVIGDNVQMTCQAPVGTMSIGPDVQIANDVKLDFTGNINIGRRCVISADVHIFTHDHGRDPRSEPKMVPLDIGDNVWIGLGAIILPSVRKIEDGAIIGAGAIVSKPVPADSIVISAATRTIARNDEVVLPR